MRCLFSGANSGEWGGWEFWSVLVPVKFGSQAVGAEKKTLPVFLLLPESFTIVSWSLVWSSTEASPHSFWASELRRKCRHDERNMIFIHDIRTDMRENQWLTLIRPKPVSFKSGLCFSGCSLTLRDLTWPHSPHWDHIKGPLHPCLLFTYPFIICLLIYLSFYILLFFLSLFIQFISGYLFFVTFCILYIFSYCIYFCICLLSCFYLRLFIFYILFISPETILRLLCGLMY